MGFPVTFANQTSPLALSNLDTNFTYAVTSAQNSTFVWIAAGGTSDAITATYSPAVTTLTDGMMLQFRATAANTTTTPTFSPNGLTAHNITRQGGVALFAGDILTNYECLVRYNSSSTVWELLNPAPTRGFITNALGGNVSLSNTGSYFDGPSVAQGTEGTWFASGSVTIADTAGAANMKVKLWDGTTVIASARVNCSAGNANQCVHLAGYIVSPAGNIRISVNDETATTGVILANDSGNSKDSIITALRIV